MRAVAQRCARARGSVPALHHYGRGLVSDGERFGAQVNLEQGVRVTEEDVRQRQRRWSGRWIAAGAFSLSFAASTVSIAFGKERVADRFAPKDVVLYQYDACPFCNKVKGRSSVSLLQLRG